MITVAHIINSNGLSETRTYDHNSPGQYRELLKLIHTILEGTMPGDEITLKQLSE